MTQRRQSDDSNPPVVSLHSIQTSVDSMHANDKMLAISAAYRSVLSPCEWNWSQDESMLMSRYVLWAHQRLCAIDQCVNGHLKHEQGND